MGEEEAVPHAVIVGVADVDEDSVMVLLALAEAEVVPLLVAVTVTLEEREALGLDSEVLLSMEETVEPTLSVTLALALPVLETLPHWDGDPLLLCKPVSVPLALFVALPVAVLQGEPVVERDADPVCETEGEGDELLDGHEEWEGEGLALADMVVECVGDQLSWLDIVWHWEGTYVCEEEDEMVTVEEAEELGLADGDALPVTVARKEAETDGLVEVLGEALTLKVALLLSAGL